MMLHKLLIALFISILLLLLTGCLATGPKMQPIDDKSEILDTYIDCYNQGDIACLRRVFSPNILSMESTETESLLDAHEVMIDKETQFNVAPLVVTDLYTLSTLQGGKSNGWMFIAHPEDKITQLYWGNHIPTLGSIDYATVAQVTDTLSTNIVLSTVEGAAELNPIMAIPSPAMLAIKLGMVQYAKGQAYPSCMSVLLSIGIWSTGGSSVNLLTLFHPAAIVALPVAMKLSYNRAEASAEETCILETIVRLES